MSEVPRAQGFCNCLVSPRDKSCQLPAMKPLLCIGQKADTFEGVAKLDNASAYEAEDLQVRILSPPYMEIEKILEEMRKTNNVVNAEVWESNLNDGFRIETDTKKNSVAEKILDKLIKLVGEKQGDYHFGIKLKSTLYSPKERIEDGSDSYIIYGTPLEDF